MDIATRFKAYKDLNREIELQIERLERMEDKAAAPSSPNLSGMPKSSSPQQDRLASDVSKIVDLKTEIQKLMERRDTERKLLDGLISRLQNPDKKTVLRLRYIDAEEWEDVLFVVFGGKEDFSEKYDNYKQRIFRYHKAALEELENISE